MSNPAWTFDKWWAVQYEAVIFQGPIAELLKVQMRRAWTAALVLNGLSVQFTEHGCNQNVSRSVTGSVPPVAAVPLSRPPK